MGELPNCFVYFLCFFFWRRSVKKSNVMAPLNLIQISDSPCLSHNFNANLIYLSYPGDGREALFVLEKCQYAQMWKRFYNWIRVTYTVVVHTNRNKQTHVPILGIWPMLVYLEVCRFIAVTFRMLKECSVGKVIADVAPVKPCWLWKSISTYYVLRGHYAWNVCKFANWLFNLKCSSCRKIVL